MDKIKFKNLENELRITQEQEEISRKNSQRS